MIILAKPYTIFATRLLIPGLFVFEITYIISFTSIFSERIENIEFFIFEHLYKLRCRLYYAINNMTKTFIFCLKEEEG